MEVKITTKPKTITRREVALLINRSVDTIDNAVLADELDFAIISGNNKPVVKNEKYRNYLNKNRK